MYRASPIIDAKVLSLNDNSRYIAMLCKVFSHLKKTLKVQKIGKRGKYKNIFIVVAVIIILLLHLQIYYHAKSGGLSFKIACVMANLVQLKVNISFLLSPVAKAHP